ncbi:MAG: ComF family protein [Clostridium sp.]
MGEKAWQLIEILILSLTEIIYPKNEKCIICDGEYVDGICSNCKGKILRCNDKESYGYYSGVLKELILKFKFHKDFQCGEILGEFLSEINIGEDINDYIVTWIPITKRVKKNRGFNQSEYLAKIFARERNLKYKKTLIKIKDTDSQKEIGREARLKNLKGSFTAIENKVKGKKIILIDDVKTTGATLSEGKLALKNAGAREIRVLTVSKSAI